MHPTSFPMIPTSVTHSPGFVVSPESTVSSESRRHHAVSETIQQLPTAVKTTTTSIQHHHPTYVSVSSLGTVSQSTSQPVFRQRSVPLNTQKASDSIRVSSRGLILPSEQMVEPTQVSSGFTQAPLGFTHVPLGFSQTPLGFSQAPGGFTQIPGGFTQVPGGFTQVPGGFTQVPGGFTQVPGGFTQVPGGFTQVPGGFTQVPGGFTQIPGGFTQVPGGFTHVRSGFSHAPSEVSSVSNNGVILSPQHPSSLYDTTAHDTASARETSSAFRASAYGTSAYGTYGTSSAGIGAPITISVPTTFTTSKYPIIRRLSNPIATASTMSGARVQEMMPSPLWTNGSPPAPVTVSSSENVTPDGQTVRTTTTRSVSPLQTIRTTTTRSVSPVQRTVSSSSTRNVSPIYQSMGYSAQTTTTSSSSGYGPSPLLVPSPLGQYAQHPPYTVSSIMGTPMPLYPNVSFPTVVSIGTDAGSNESVLSHSLRPNDSGSASGDVASSGVGSSVYGGQ